MEAGEQGLFTGIIGYYWLTVNSSQAASLRQLEDENHEAAARLEEVVYRGDMLLEKIQSALADIAQSQLRTRNGAPSQTSPSESWHAKFLTEFWTLSLIL